jgi:nitrite reductase/ring-hydroxylating ferredoxin subunit
MSDCQQCALKERREFLREAGLLLAGAFLAPLPIRFGPALAANGDERTYPIPDADGATIDKENEVIVVRFEQHAYAFNLSCPHQHTALRWHPEDGQFQCPKHHSRYRPDGVFISGRATRSMDRFAVRRDGANLVVDLDRLYRQDRDPGPWEAAVVPV